MTRYSKTMTEALQEIREGFSAKQIKMAIGVASDKRYAGGNYDGAVDAIEKIKKGLSDHPQVAAVLKRQNEDIEEEIEEEIEIDEMKMDDPKLVKTFDKLKKGQTIKLKTSSTINQGKDFVEYIVKSKNTVNKGRVEKVTLVTKGNEKAVKKFLYKRDGKVTFAIGDMGASIDDIKEGTWALPDSPKAKAELKKLMSKPIKLGKEGDEASDKLYALIGDDELFDDLYVAGKKNPNGDARDVVKKHMKRLGIKEETELDETKSATGYEIFHKDFSSAMQHATAFAKSKGQPIKKDEIDNKVATGPKKPSKGKENSYNLETEKGKRWSVQVYNMGNKFELNMYLTSSHVPEGDMLDEAVNYKFAAVDKKGLVIGFSSDERDAKDMARRNKGRVVTLTKPLAPKKGDMMVNRPLPDKMDKFPTNTSATQGKRMGEEDEKKPDMRPDSAKEVEQGRDDKKKTRIAQLQLQIAKAQETINKLNAQEKPNG